MVNTWKDVRESYLATNGKFVDELAAAENGSIFHDPEGSNDQILFDGNTPKVAKLFFDHCGLKVVAPLEAGCKIAAMAVEGKNCIDEDPFYMVVSGKDQAGLLIPAYKEGEIRTVNTKKLMDKVGMRAQNLVRQRNEK